MVEYLGIQTRLHQNAGHSSTNGKVERIPTVFDQQEFYQLLSYIR